MNSRIIDTEEHPWTDTEGYPKEKVMESVSSEIIDSEGHPWTVKWLNIHEQQILKDIHQQNFIDTEGYARITKAIYLVGSAKALTKILLQCNNTWVFFRHID